MLERLLEFSLRQRLLIILIAIGILLWGTHALLNLPIDAFPDVTGTVVDIFAEAPGMAPQELEAQLTFPIEIAMNGLPKVSTVRSASTFGLSRVTVVFEDGVNIYFARQVISERLQSLAGKLPSGVQPLLGPITTGMGQIYQYTVEGHGKDLMELRTIQDWLVKPQLMSVPGVSGDLSLGGFVKQYQVFAKPEKLKAHGLTIHQVFAALTENNANAGGSFIERGSEEYIIRGIGLIKDLDDIRGIVIKAENGTPIRVRDVAEVAIGPEVRRGALSKDGTEKVAGIVLQLQGENTLQVIDRVKRKLAELRQALPQGVSILSFYDQTDLVQRSVAMMRKAIAEEGLVAVAVLWVLLWNFRSALIVSLSIPIGVLLAFILMSLTGLPANLMSLAGLAIGIGMMTDPAIVLVENVFRHLGKARGRDVIEVTLEAAKEVARPIFFGILIIIVSFLPIFTLLGVEGKMFSPMAYTKSYAMLGALIMSLTLVPALCTLVLRGRLPEGESPVIRWAKALYLPILKGALRHRLLSLFVPLALLAASLGVVPLLGTEFLPAMDEGSILIRATMLPSISLTKSLETSQRIEKMLLDFPEVATVVSKVGRAEVGADIDPVSISEIFVDLKPQQLWKVRTKNELIEAMEKRLSTIPGIALSFTQPIANRVNEIVSGVKTQVAIKLFGDDLKLLQAKAHEVEEAVAEVPGVTDLFTEQLSGTPQLLIDINREAISRYGINVAAVRETIEAGIGGKVATEVLEGQKRFELLLRLPYEDRADMSALKNLLISAPGGQRVPMAQLASVKVEDAPFLISRENRVRRVLIQCNVRGRDVGGFVADVQRAIASKVKLPEGYFITYGGQFELQQRAMARLKIVVPIVLGLILIFLYATFGSLGHTLQIALNVPFALIGGIFALWLSRQYLSVAASVGFIALFGVAVLNGVVLVSYIGKLRAEGSGLDEAIIRGTELRLRPVLMTALVASIGLIPLVLATGTGSEIQKPLATVVIGGLLSSTPLTLIVLPALYPWFEGRRGTLRHRRDGGDAAQSSGGAMTSE